jgi:hypothetical protein
MDDRLEERLDRLVSRGRRLVDGVSGARPGSRSAARGGERRSGGRPGTPGGLGRWVEGTLDWLLEDGEDWREPWEEGGAAAGVPAPPARPRRPLEAISRRGRVSASARATPERPAAAAGSDAGVAGDLEDALTGEAWPADDDFSLPRWQRPPTPARSPEPPPKGAGGRPLPRSSRRR